jgi:hypothetical protein
MYTIKLFIDFCMILYFVDLCINLRSYDFQPYRIIIKIFIRKELCFDWTFHETPLKVHQQNAQYLLITYIYCE